MVILPRIILVDIVMYSHMTTRSDVVMCGVKFLNSLIHCVRYSNSTHIGLSCTMKKTSLRMS